MYRGSNHQARDCNARLRGRTLIFPSNTNQEPVQKKRKFNKEQLIITDLGSEEDLGNKSDINHHPSDILLNISQS